MPTTQQNNTPRQEKEFDVLIKYGKVIDPSHNWVPTLLDVAIKGTTIKEVAAGIVEERAHRVLNARDCIVTPGLIDAHVHLYDDVTPLGVAADPNCIYKGVTTAIDAGSAGAHTFPGFRRYVIKAAETRVLALLNISVIGIASQSEKNQHGELLDLRYVNSGLAFDTIQANKDVICGIKIRMSRSLTDGNDLCALSAAREVALKTGLPLMVHIGDSFTTLKEILDRLEPGDIVTHCFRKGPGSILDCLEDVKRAKARGVWLDVGHGKSAFSFETAEEAINNGVRPDIISSDLHRYNVTGPVYDLATTLSKFSCLKIKPEINIIKCATENPANAFNLPVNTKIEVTAEADVSILEWHEGEFPFYDSMDNPPRWGKFKLIPKYAIKAGRVYTCTQECPQNATKGGMKP